MKIIYTRSNFTSNFFLISGDQAACYQQGWRTKIGHNLYYNRINFVESRCYHSKTIL